MNHSYRLIWNDLTQRCVPAPETARGRGKSRAAVVLASAALVLAAPVGAQVLPRSGQVVSGKAGISQSGAQMTIDQASQKAILHWQGFDIGSGARVQFKQPDASAVALNRVVAGNASRIDGQLSANGQVWLVNPNGVVFGKGSQVNVGGLVASTMDITNEDFDAGRQVFTRGAAQGGITNQGDITVADGGTLALLAPTVGNEGTLSARLGNVVLAGGDKVTLQAGVDGRLQVAVDPATVATLIENKQLITADGGQVVMTSRAADALSASVVSNSGTVQARTLAEKEGRILLLADMRHGETVHSGRLDASAPHGGNGGFVDTSAATVRIEAGAQVSTAAPRGKTGNWLIDPTDLSIGAGGAAQTRSGIGADTLMDNLATTSVTLQTAAEGAEKGDIHVDAPVGWSRNTLTLNAHGSININAVMTASGTAALEMNYGGYSASRKAAEGSGVHMALTDKGFGGRVDFKDVLDQGNPAHQRLKINGDSYTLLTQLGEAGSTTGLDLQGIEGNLSGKYALGADIDATATHGWFNGAGFAPIGSVAGPFTGAFDGLGHAITRLTIKRGKELGAAGLFGDTLNAVLRNVGLEQITVQGANVVGGLAGVSLAEGRDALALVSHVYATGQVSGTYTVGGLVGSNQASNGGTASISNAHALGVEVTASKNSIGGLVGENAADGESTARIDHASASGQVSGNLRVGGLVGYNVAFGAAKALISDAHATGVVKGASTVGGLVGHNDANEGATASISSSQATGVQVVGTGGKVGGLVGLNWVDTGSTASISGSHAAGTVSGADSVGGLVGSNEAHGGKAVISASHAAGAVSGSHQIGGLVGANTAEAGEAIVLDTYATGPVAGVGQVGGLVGTHAGEGGAARILQSYATGRVQGSSDVGGLVGEGNFSIDGSFHATTDAQGNSINSGAGFNHLGQGKPFADLMKLSTFAGWDIDDQGGTGRTWRLYEGSSTPLLRSFLQPLTVSPRSADVHGKTYDGRIASGQVGYISALPAAGLGGQLRYATAGSNAGSYTLADGTLSLGGLYSDQRGYDIAYAGETAGLSVTIGKAPLTITARDAWKAEGQPLYFGGTEFYVGAGLVNGETVRRVALYSLGSSYHAQAGDHAIELANAQGDGGFDARNYDIHYVQGTMTVFDGNSLADIPGASMCRSLANRPAVRCAVQQRASAPAHLPPQRPVIVMTPDFIRMP